MPASWRNWWHSYCRAAVAEGKSLHTLDGYGQAWAQLGCYLADRGRHDPLAVTKNDIRSFMLHLQARGLKPKTLLDRWGGLRAVYAWLVEEEQELEKSPLYGLKPPKVPDEPLELVDADVLRRLLGACEGRDFAARRDTALISILIDSGARRGAVASMTLEGTDLDGGTSIVYRKGGGHYLAFFGRRTARDLDRYLRVRARHKHAGVTFPRSDSHPPDLHGLHPLWIGERGAMTGWGIYQVVRGRAGDAGIQERMFVHLFRHLFAHGLKMSGARDEDIMAAGGWTSHASMARYGRSMAAARAKATHQRLSPRDQL